MNFKSIGQIILSVADILRPAEELSVSEAAAKYRYVNQPGAYVGNWLNTTTPMMVEPMDVFTSREYSGEVFVGPAQSGKALAVNTPIATPGGWTTMGELRVGDTVFDDCGNPTKVTFVTGVMHDHLCFELTFDDHTSIVADADHKWECFDDVKTFKRVLTTVEIADTYRYGVNLHRNRYAIDNAGALALPEIPLPVDPYTLGVWLGDGHAYSAQLCLNEIDLEIVEHIEAAGHRTWVRKDADQKSVTVQIDPNLHHDRVGTFRQSLVELGLLKNKHIPAVFLRASEEQRRALLQGLNDTDGCIGLKSGVVEFSTSDLRIAEGYEELCASLGIKTRRSSRTPAYSYQGQKRIGKVSYRITSLPRLEDAPFRLKRHIARLKPRITGRAGYTDRRRIVKVERVKSCPVLCIQVAAKSHLFLAGRQMVPTHNTDSLIINTVAYTIKVEPMDTMIVCPTMTAGRDFSIRRIDRLHRHSEKIGAMLMGGSDHDNKFDKHYINGMLLTISWPTPTELAGKPIGRIVMTDFDRMPMDVAGDGNPYDLASKRTTTFGSYAMTLAESSPSKPVTDIKWIPRTPHEAPPCEGILALYNRGDKRRWYWPCPKCSSYFEGRFEMLTYERRADQTNLEISETVRMKCPHCSYSIHPDERDAMQQRGRWVKDGQGVGKDGVVFGPKPRTSIASFWLRGVAAVFTNWKKLLELYLNADDEFERTNSEEALRKFYNNDLGEPYYEKGSHELRLPETLKARAEPLRERHVPPGVRFLVALVDVQNNMWVVQVLGILPGRPFDIVVVDRFEVKYSKRLNEADERLWVKPAAYLEDWDELTEHVINKSYPLDDDSGRAMSIKMVGCDSGGKAGVTSKAYDYYRSLRAQGLHRRFILVKGDGKPANPRCRISYPDANQKDNKSAARGDIPILVFNSNLLKDDLNGRLDCIEPGKGMFRTPNWLDDKFYAELCAEIRGPKGWENPAGHRNENWDLAYYGIGVCVSELIRVESINWQNPPSWATDWVDGGANDLVFQMENDAPFANTIKSAYDFSQFGKALA